MTKKIVVLGTGGTIAGRAGSAGDNLGYTAAQVGV
ncbi:MAG: asparaginase, partial [Burkholderiaceae bacterium]